MYSLEAVGVHIGVDRRPVQARGHPVLICLSRHLDPCLRVHRGGQDIRVRDIDKLCMRLCRRMVGHPCAQPGADQGIGLYRIRLSERYAVSFVCFPVQPVEPTRIQALPGRRGVPDQEVKERRCLRLQRSWLLADRRNQNAAQVL